MSKASNEQIRLLKMYQVTFDKNISYKKADTLLASAQRKHKERIDYNIKSNGDLEGSNWFSRWLEK